MFKYPIFWINFSRKKLTFLTNFRLPDDLEGVTADQEVVSENLYSEFEILCNKLTAEDARKIDTNVKNFQKKNLIFNAI